MTFLDSLNQLGGTLVGSVGEAGSLFLDAKLQKELGRSTSRPQQTIQPELAAPTPPPPTKSVNSNGETVVAPQTQPKEPMFSKKALQLGGLGLVGLVTAIVLIKVSK